MMTLKVMTVMMTVMMMMVWAVKIMSTILTTMVIILRTRTKTMPTMIFAGDGCVWFPSSCLPILQTAYGQTWARMHHKVVGNFRSEADVRSLYYRR